MSAQADWKDCDGNAHQPDYDQDHCGVCMPFWGRYPVCPYCKNRLGKRPTGKMYRCVNGACPHHDAIFDTSSRGHTP